MASVASASASAAGAAETEFQTVTESKATILFPTNTNEVFYNPIQNFNRDLSVAVINTFIPQYKQDVAAKRIKRDNHETELPITVLEALSASGLRAVRYFHEIPGLTYVMANDLSAHAVKNIERNVLHNNLTLKQVIPNHGDAAVVMHLHKELPSSVDPTANARFTVVDLDPYGTAAPFLDAAVQSVDEGGLLCVTCTDMAVLSGNHSDVSWAKYSSMAVRTPYCHEMAVRIVLSSISSHAARYKRYIVPILSLSIDFYVRMFVRVYTSAAEVKRSASKVSNFFHCSGCHSFYLQPIGRRQENGNSKKYTPAHGPTAPPRCTFCNYPFQMGGPVWSEPIHDRAFVKSVLEHIESSPENAYATRVRMQGMLTLAHEELPDVPFYYAIPTLAGTVRCEIPSLLQIHSAVWNANYQSSSSHANPDALKTNCPPEVIWDIMRSWVKLHPVVQKNIKPNSPAARILAAPSTIEGSFELHPSANPVSRKLKMVRFPDLPPNSGPKSRAKSGNRQQLARNATKRKKASDSNEEDEVDGEGEGDGGDDAAMGEGIDADEQQQQHESAADEASSAKRPRADA